MSEVRCHKCQHVRTIDFCDGLSKGWPTCCGETMRLGPVSQKEIDEGVAKVMKPLDVIRSILERK